MEAVMSRREGVALGFFGIVIVAVALMTVYGLTIGRSTRTESAYRPEQTVNLTEQAARLEAALRANPQDLRSLVALGDTYLDLRRGGEAVGLFQRAEAINPNDTHVLSDLGNLYQQAGNYDAALQKFSRIGELEPANLGAMLHQGLLHKLKGDPAKALEIFRTLLSRNPDPQVAQMARSQVTAIEAGQ